MFEVYGLKGSYQDGISNEFYFDGLLVAMIMGYNPVGIIGMSILFCRPAHWRYGHGAPRRRPGEIYRIIRSVIIFFMAGGSGISAAWQARRARNQARREAAARLEANHG